MSKKQESSRKTSISALLTMPKPLTVWITINWKILKQMEIPDPLTCFLRNLYAGQEAIVRTGHRTTDCFQIGTGVCQGCIFPLPDPPTFCAWLLYPYNCPGSNTGVGSHSFLQGIFLTQGLNPGLPHCRQILYHLSHQGSTPFPKQFSTSEPTGKNTQIA